MAFRILTIIPARSGSKGLRGKNIRLLAGKPLLVHAIELAQRSKRSSEDWAIMVSTNSPKYARLAKSAGALVPQLRPPHLAQDESKLTDVIFYTLPLMERSHGPFDCVLMLSPTTPLTKPSDIRRGIELLKTRKAQSAVSVVEDQLPPSWIFKIKNESLYQKSPTKVQRRQTVDTSYRLNGAIYLAQPQWLHKNGQFVKTGETKPIIMPKSRSLDIENADDLKIAHHLLRSP
uniref:CMP-N-acetylneuraminic acid synthetase n=1 Tax=uncultured myxobacterium HF0200_19H16 TaxID=723559 RepID=E7C3V9_9BACT|nr:CMP-N-acetylneuraminic acid synthetase [uncultured myxobacterium HF0200_19H16]